MELGFPMESTVEAMNPNPAMSACNYALTQYDQHFLPTYLEDCMKDPDLQSFDAKMEKRSKALIDTAKKDGGLSLEVLDGVVTTISDLGQEIAYAVGNFKSQMTAMKDDRYQAVVDEYLVCSSGMLNFCTDMETFLYEAREIHSLIEAQIQECVKLGSKNVIGSEDAQKIVNILNNIMSSASKDHSADKLRERVGILLEKQKKLVEHVTRIEQLQEQEKKEETVPLKNKKEESVPFWRKLINYLYMGVKIVAVSLAAFFSNIVSATASKFPTDSAKHWSCSLFQGIVTMKEGARNSVKEMGNFIHAISSIINDIEALRVTGTKFATGIPVSVAFSHIINMLTNFMKHICALETKTENCNSIISDARDKLL